MNSPPERLVRALVGLVVVSWLCGGCGSEADIARNPTDSVRASLGTLQRIDPYPIYVMHWIGSTSSVTAAPVHDDALSATPDWACSLFAALGDPDLEAVGHLQMMRRILEGARTTEQAVARIETMSLRNQGGPPLHYLIADCETAVVLEFVGGGCVVHRTADAWHCATNFTLALADTWDGVCPRFDTLTHAVSGAGGVLSPDEAMDLLQDVSNRVVLEIERAHPLPRLASIRQISTL